MFDELLTHPGVREELTLRSSSVGFLAYHGGSLERGTDPLAEGAASAAGASCYVVRQPDDLRWHVPSRVVGTRRSPALDAFIDHVDLAISLHGYGRAGMGASLLLGGSNRALATHVGKHLRAALPGFEVVTDLDAIPVALRGVHRDNPVNLPRDGGVQIELPPRARGLDLRGAHRAAGPASPAPALVEALAAAASLVTPA